MHKKALTWLSLVAGVALVLTGYLVLRPQQSEVGAPTSSASERTTSANPGNEADVPDSGLPPKARARSQASIEDSATEVSEHSFARLVIPKLKVDAPVHEVGMSTDPSDPKYRILSPPSDPDQIGWWSGGPLPGSPKGTTLLIGHTKKRSGVAGIGDGALGYISRLSAGDSIDVEVEGRTVAYRVERVVPDQPFSTVANEAGSIDDREYPGGRLVLVTCWFDGSTFTGNTLVYATPM
ncbi:class F sortase [Flindersiella endophytica]